MGGTVNCSILATLSQSSKTTASKLPLKNALITTMWFYSSDFGVARLLQFAVKHKPDDKSHNSKHRTNKGH